MRNFLVPCHLNGAGYGLKPTMTTLMLSSLEIIEKNKFSQRDLYIIKNIEPIHNRLLEIFGTKCTTYWLLLKVHNSL